MARAPKGTIVCVKMHREPEQFPAPHSADVHPAEVETYGAAGWIVSRDQAGAVVLPSAATADDEA